MPAKYILPNCMIDCVSSGTKLQYAIFVKERVAHGTIDKETTLALRGS